MGENKTLEKQNACIEQEMLDYDQNRSKRLDQIPSKNSAEVQALEAKINTLEKEITAQKKKLSNAETKIVSDNSTSFIEPSKPAAVPTPIPTQSKKARRTLVSPKSASTKKASKSPPKALSKMKSLWSSSEED